MSTSSDWGRKTGASIFSSDLQSLFASLPELPSISEPERTAPKAKIEPLAEPESNFEPESEAKPEPKSEPVTHFEQRAVLADSEKDQLIAQLMERLEQTADQLDRMKRSGGQEGTGGGVPEEFLDEQRELSGELRQFLDSQDQLHISSSLTRIEVQIQELRDLVVQYGTFPSRTENPEIDTLDPEPETSPEAPAASASAEPEEVSWERMKAALLGEKPPQETHEQEPEPVTKKTILDEILENGPPPIDLEQAGIDELREAVQLRDNYIESLVSQCKALKQTEDVCDFPELDQIPESCRPALILWQQQIERAARQAEVQISLERAKLSRDQALLQTQQDKLYKELERLQPRVTKGLDPVEDGKTRQRRWFQFLNSQNESK